MAKRLIGFAMNQRRSKNSHRIPDHKKIGGKEIAPCRHRFCPSTVFALCL
jgi:hypothetical protein